MKINKKLIKELVICLEENKLSELEYSEKDIKIKVARNLINDNSKIQVAQNTNEIKEEKIISGTEIKSPIIGTAYLAPEPGGKKFVEIGKKSKRRYRYDSRSNENYEPCSINKGWSCKKIVVDDGQPVEFGQTLVILE